MPRKCSYTAAELFEVAAGLRRVLAAIEAGDLTANPGAWPPGSKAPWPPSKP